MFLIIALWILALQFEQRNWMRASWNKLKIFCRTKTTFKRVPVPALVPILSTTKTCNGKSQIILYLLGVSKFPGCSAPSALNYLSGWVGAEITIQSSASCFAILHASRRLWLDGLTLTPRVPDARIFFGK